MLQCRRMWCAWVRLVLSNPISCADRHSLSTHTSSTSQHASDGQPSNLSRNPGSHSTRDRLGPFSICHNGCYLNYELFSFTIVRPQDLGHVRRRHGYHSLQSRVCSRQPTKATQLHTTTPSYNLELRTVIHQNARANQMDRIGTSF